MRLLDRLTIQYKNELRHIEIYHSDLSAIPLEEKVDLLVVSSFPNDYVLTSGSMIGALYRRGLSVAHLAKTQQPPAKAGGLKLRTESPDTGR